MIELGMSASELPANERNVVVGIVTPAAELKQWATLTRALHRRLHPSVDGRMSARPGGAAE
ncbi:hypothetical protein [Luteitalea sp.]|uniref:hypothetical protein n=1 Tax=Luteitalea sp. TaxID=2004800 RepID=UPI0025C01341|nr:hypothetical protein [Luteitalea sp.]